MAKKRKRDGGVSENWAETLKVAGWLRPGSSCQSSHNLPCSADGANWKLADVDVPEGYMAAVAVETGMDSLAYFEWRRASGE